MIVRIIRVDMVVIDVDITTREDVMHNVTKIQIPNNEFQNNEFQNNDLGVHISNSEDSDSKYRNPEIQIKDPHCEFKKTLLCRSLT